MIRIFCHIKLIGKSPIIPHMKVVSPCVLVSGLGNHHLSLRMSSPLARGQQVFSVKGQIANT